jgi:hypothetical protein
MGEYKIKLPATMVKVNKSITALSHAPVVLDIGRCFPSNNQPSSQTLLREMNKPPSLRLVQESSGTQAAPTILRELNSFYLCTHCASYCQHQPSGLTEILCNSAMHSTMTTKKDSTPVEENPLRT